MGEIVELSTGTKHGWTGMERVIRLSLTKGGAPDDMQKEVLEGTKEFFEHFDHGFNLVFDLPGTLSSADRKTVMTAIERTVREHEKHLNDFMNQLLIDHIKAEIELYELRHS